LLAALTERGKDNEGEGVPQEEFQNTADDHQETAHEIVRATLIVD